MIGGTREDGPAPETRLTNNAILLKLKIALNLRTDEVLELLALGGMSLGKSELTAFFRRPDHRHFRRCNDQVLRNFLTGLQRRLRPAIPQGEKDTPGEDPWASARKKC